MLRGASQDLPEMPTQSTEVGVVICTCVAEYGNNIRCTRRACKCEYENSCAFVDGAPSTLIPYSRKYWRGIKFGGLVCEQTAKLKSANYIYPSFIRYRNAKTAKLKSANFDFRRLSRNPPNIRNSRQYFRLYSTTYALIKCADTQ